MNNRLSILFIGYDGYSDLWDDCINLFKRFWKDCPYEMIFVNNSKFVSWENVTVLHAGEDAEWSKKVQIGLSYIKTEYVCLMLEDFLVGSDIVTSNIENLITIMDSYLIDYIKLTDLNNPKKDHLKHFLEYKYLHQIKSNNDYGISLQASIWRKSFLKTIIGDANYNAWIFEFNRVKETNIHDRSFRKNALFDIRNVLNLKHGVIQGEYIPTTIKYFKKLGISLNIQRPIMKRSKYKKTRFVYWCRNSMTPKFRHTVKKIMEKMGFSFVSTKRDIK